MRCAATSTPAVCAGIRVRIASLRRFLRPSSKFLLRSLLLLFYRDLPLPLPALPLSPVFTFCPFIRLPNTAINMTQVSVSIFIASKQLGVAALASILTAVLFLAVPTTTGQSQQPDSPLLRSIPGALSAPAANSSTPTSAVRQPAVTTTPAGTPQQQQATLADGNGLRIAPSSTAQQPQALAPATQPLQAPATPEPEAIVRALTGAAPLQPPRDIARTGYWQANGYWLLPLGAALVLVVAALGFVFYRRSRRPVVLSPQLLALQGIDAATAHSDDKLFAIYVSDAVRTYLEARFQLRAPEQTTEEFLQEVRHGSRLPQPSVQPLAHLLELCDLAKFARQGLSAAQRSELAESARQLVQSLEQPQPTDDPPLQQGDGADASAHDKMAHTKAPPSNTAQRDADQQTRSTPPLPPVER